MSARADALFVGRHKEMERLRRELAAGHNLVLTGRFGVGRTTLLRRLAREEEKARRFLFVDGALPPGQMAPRIFLALFPSQADALQRARNPLSFVKEALGARALPDRRPHVVVLDGVAKLTPQRLAFLRWLRDLERFQIFAVTEHFLPQEDLWRLRTLLVPAPLVVLDKLGAAACAEFFRRYAEREGLAWDEGTIQGLAQASQGYPLTMWELAGASAGRAPAPGDEGAGEASRAGARFSWIGDRGRR